MNKWQLLCDGKIVSDISVQDLLSISIIISSIKDRFPNAPKSIECGRWEIQEYANYR